ncbi:MAG: hypothetical protein NT091_01460, partial [Candidatus Falkowbacteria bacterium]|nr:hypothetical protein [Candidatus Falkowbacteria bacterium]
MFDQNSNNTAPNLANQPMVGPQPAAPPLPAPNKILANPANVLSSFPPENKFNSPEDIFATVDKKPQVNPLITPKSGSVKSGSSNSMVMTSLAFGALGL